MMMDTINKLREAIQALTDVLRSNPDRPSDDYNAIDAALVKITEAIDLEVAVFDVHGGLENVTLEAKVAARWWADRLRYGSKMQQVRREQSTRETDMAEVLSSMLAHKQQVLSPRGIDQFEVALAAIIDRRHTSGIGWLEAKKDPNWGSAVRVVDVDYGACDLLRAAYQAAGGSTASTGIFPIKTVMRISPGSVVVRYGYGAPETELIVDGKPFWEVEETSGN